MIEDEFILSILGAEEVLGQITMIRSQAEIKIKQQLRDKQQREVRFIPILKLNI